MCERRNECEIQSGRQIQFVAVAPGAAQQGGLSDQAAALAGEQVNAVVDIRLAVGEPVGDDFSVQSNTVNTVRRFGGEPFGLAVPDQNRAIAPVQRRADCEVDGLQVSQFIEAQPVRSRPP